MIRAQNLQTSIKTLKLGEHVIRLFPRRGTAIPLRRAFSASSGIGQIPEDVE